MNNNELIAFVKANPVGVLSTMGEDGISAAAVYYIVDEDGTMYFNTHQDSAKLQNIIRDPQIAFTAFSREPAMTLQVRGDAHVIDDISSIESLYTELLHRIFQSDTVPPVLKMGGSRMELVKITPTWMRLGSFSHNQNGADSYTIIIGNDAK
ncbi:MAG: pyridoxamine 5'-phosphate oxidase family protein [Candidatus Pacebacteria bacterium]|jgi:general stress protein 26|nr:pyridoxamine 5'-phosphate oxidase family protein [Candidatus Paceibacterota bacterium]